MIAAAGPYAFSTHALVWALLVAAAVAVAVAHRRLAARQGSHANPWTARQAAALVGAFVAAAVALTWPLADLAAHWSLTALVTQRLILLLAVAPLALVGLPYDVLAALTRPAAVDAALERLRRPGVAIPVLAVVAIGTFVVPAVEAQASSPVVRGVLDAVWILAGFVLWLPVVGRVPGILRLRPVGRFVYLVVQAVLPAFLSVLYIFARHPFYPCFAHAHEAIGIQPLTDQQVAGFVSKLAMLFVLITVGAVVLLRAQRADEDYGAHEPLVWADVERAIERTERREARRGAAPPAELPGETPPS